MKRLFLLFVLLMAALGVNAQATYPVQVNVNLVPPYSLYLDDYATGARERISVTLINRDMQYPSMAVRLRLTIKGNGFTLKTNDYAALAPIVIEPNMPYRLSQEELAPYFNPQNLTANGMGSAAWQKDRKLPEGMLEFCFEAVEHQTGRKMSLPSCGMAWVTTHKPPVLSLPFNGETVAYRDPLNLLFQWTPQHSGLGNVEYQLIIKQLWDNGLKPEAAWAYSTEILRETVKPTSMLYGAALPPLTPGMRYAWAVQAIAKEGMDEVRVFENNGLSEIRWFTLAEHCPPPTSVTANAINGRIALEWIPLPEHLSFTVSYRQQGQEGTEWFYTKTDLPRLTLYDVRPGYTYEYRIGSSCKPDNPIYGQVYTIAIPMQDTAYNAQCGVLPAVDVSNKEPLPVLAPGEQFMAGDFPVFVTMASGSNGNFSGEGYTIMPSLFAGAKLQVKWSNITINTDRRMIVGEVNAVYDEANSQIANMDDIFEGGALVGKVDQGITKADIDLSFTITDNTTFIYNPDKGEVTITDGDNTITIPVGKDNLEGNTGKSIFPITVKDDKGNIYKVEENPNATPDEDGNLPLVVTPIGKAGEPIPAGAVNYTQIATDKAIVTFEKGDGEYAFDTWRKEYLTADLIHSKYEKLGDGYVPFKLLPPGKTDVVQARIVITDKELDPNKVLFKTPKGTEFSYKYENNTYIINLTGGEAGDGQEIYALYPNGSKYYNLGKLMVMSYPEETYKAVIVPVNGISVDVSTVSKRLQEIYAPVGITWEVSEDKDFKYTVSSLESEGSNLFSVYTPEMKALNKAYQHYVDSTGRELAADAVYLFALESGDMKGTSLAGDMPRSTQFGYLFTQNATADKLAQTAAHELGHGKLALKHTFDDSYKVLEGSTDNLMDYAGGTHIAKWQWDLIHDHGLVMNIFERDEDAMAIGNTFDSIYVYNGANRITENSFQLISATPTMPDIRAKAFMNNYSGNDSVYMQLKIEYKRNNNNGQIRNDNSSYPSTGWQKVKINEIWDINFGNEIRGGKAYLICRSTNRTDTLIFYIRGTNPTEQEVRNYITAQGYNEWFLFKLIRHESGTPVGTSMRQFNPGTNYGTPWSSTIGCPNLGAPRGFGLMQLDNFGAQNNQLILPTAQELWSWKANIDRGVTFLRQDKAAWANNRMNGYNTIVAAWNIENSDNQVSDSIQIDGGQNIGTTVLNIQEGNNTIHETFAITPVAGQRAMADALTLKYYNGGAYCTLRRGGDLKPYWTINRVNNLNFNYVERVCSENP